MTRCCVPGLKMSTSSSSGASCLPLPLRSSHPPRPASTSAGCDCREQVLAHRLEQGGEAGRRPSLGGRCGRDCVRHEQPRHAVGHGVEERREHVGVAHRPEATHLPLQHGVGLVAHQQRDRRQIELALARRDVLGGLLGGLEQRGGGREVLEVARHHRERTAVTREQEAVDLVDDLHGPRDEVAVSGAAVGGVGLLGGSAARKRRAPLPRREGCCAARDLRALARVRGRCASAARRTRRRRSRRGHHDRNEKRPTHRDPKTTPKKHVDFLLEQESFERNVRRTDATYIKVWQVQRDLRVRERAHARCLSMGRRRAVRCRPPWGS
jgi:hypothetical protein